MATKAMRDEHNRAISLVNSKVQLIDPGVAMGIVPHAQIDALALRQLSLPHGLSMVGAAVVRAGNQQGQRFVRVRQAAI